jgi:hypothetical protein
MNKIKSFLLGFTFGALGASACQILLFNHINKHIIISGIIVGCMELYICVTDKTEAKMIDY